MSRRGPRSTVVPEWSKIQVLVLVNGWTRSKDTPRFFRASDEAPETRRRKKVLVFPSDDKYLHRSLSIGTQKTHLDPLCPGVLEGPETQGPGGYRPSRELLGVTVGRTTTHPSRHPFPPPPGTVTGAQGRRRDLGVSGRVRVVLLDRSQRRNRGPMSRNPFERSAKGCEGLWASLR